MAFVLVPFPSVRQVARIAEDALRDPLGPRILKQHVDGMRIALDEYRDAYLLQVDATARHNSGQLHYMLYCGGRFFHLRTKNLFSTEVCFYGFPADQESHRAVIERCFSDAAPVFGWFGDVTKPEENAHFVPTFGPDDWEPADF